MILEHLGYQVAADAVMTAIETVLAEGPHTPEIVGKAVAAVVASTGR